MPIQNVRFQCTGKPDVQAVKAQLSSIYGVVEMNIDTKSNSVEVLFDDSLTSPDKIDARLGLNYQQLR